MSGIIGMNTWEKPKQKPVDIILQDIPVSIQDLCNSKRYAPLVKYRKKLARLMRREGYTIQEIADTLNKHHSTIIYYLR